MFTFHKDDAPTHACPEDGCDRFRTRRPDKLSEHLRKKHGIYRPRTRHHSVFEGAAAEVSKRLLRL
jgi:hypothetical protein